MIDICKKCKVKFEYSKIQLDLDYNSYSETTFAECPKCGDIFECGTDIIDCTPKIGYDNNGEYYNNDF